MKKGLLPLEVGIKFQTTLTLGWTFVVSDAVTLILEQVFEGDCSLIVDEFLYYYKISEISQSLGFHQYTTRGKDCRLIKSLPTSDRNWKTEFFFIFVFRFSFKFYLKCLKL